MCLEMGLSIRLLGWNWGYCAPGDIGFNMSLVAIQSSFFGCKVRPLTLALFLLLLQSCLLLDMWCWDMNFRTRLIIIKLMLLNSFTISYEWPG